MTNRFLTTACLSAFVFLACNQQGNKTNNTSATDSNELNNANNKIDSNSPTTILPFTEVKDTVSYWVYDDINAIPVKNREVNADTLEVKKLIHFINESNSNIRLDFIRRSHDTLYTSIKESTYLSQQMGTTGADGWVSVAVFTLTELRGIRYVNFEFEEGDHAVPGTYSRQTYYERNRMSNAGKKKQ